MWPQEAASSWTRPCAQLHKASTTLAPVEWRNLRVALPCSTTGSEIIYRWSLTEEPNIGQLFHLVWSKHLYLSSLWSQLLPRKWGTWPYEALMRAYVHIRTLMIACLKFCTINRPGVLWSALNTHLYCFPAMPCNRSYFQTRMGLTGLHHPT
jgi:hypothetical protein